MLEIQHPPKNFTPYLSHVHGAGGDTWSEEILLRLSAQSRALLEATFCEASPKENEALTFRPLSTTEYQDFSLWETKLVAARSLFLPPH